MTKYAWDVYWIAGMEQKGESKSLMAQAEREAVGQVTGILRIET